MSARFWQTCRDGILLPPERLKEEHGHAALCKEISEIVLSHGGRVETDILLEDFCIEICQEETRSILSLQARDGRTIVRSEGYADRDECDLALYKNNALLSIAAALRDGKADQ